MRKRSPIDRLHVTSLPPCWRTITKDSSLVPIVSLSNMVAMSLLFDSLGIDQPRPQGPPRERALGTRLSIVRKFRGQIICCQV